MLGVACDRSWDQRESEALLPASRHPGCTCGTRPTTALTGIPCMQGKIMAQTSSPPSPVPQSARPPPEEPCAYGEGWDVTSGVGKTLRMKGGNPMQASMLQCKRRGSNSLGVGLHREDTELRVNACGT